MTSAVVPLESPERPPMPARRTLGAYLLEARFECLRALRQPGFAGPLLILPGALYLLFAVVLFGDAIRKETHGAPFVFVGFTVLGIMGPGLFGGGIFVALEREQGGLRLKRALPLPMAAYVVAKAALVVVFAALVVLTMSLVAPFGRAGLSPARLLAVSLIGVAGALPFTALGLLVGSFASGKSAPAFVNLLYLPMLYLSGFLFPLPASIRWIALASPAFYLDQLMLRAAGIPTSVSSLPCAGALLALTLIPGALAVRRLARRG